MLLLLLPSSASPPLPTAPPLLFTAPPLLLLSTAWLAGDSTANSGGWWWLPRALLKLGPRSRGADSLAKALTTKSSCALTVALSSTTLPWRLEDERAVGRPAATLRLVALTAGSTGERMPVSGSGSRVPPPSFAHSGES